MTDVPTRVTRDTYSELLHIQSYMIPIKHIVKYSAS